MYIFWLIFMALIIAYLAVPLARTLGYSYGRYGRFTDIFLVLTGTLAFGIMTILGLTTVGYWTGDTFIALLIGSIGAMLMVFLLTLFSVESTSDEDNLISSNNHLEI